MKGQPFDQTEKPRTAVIGSGPAGLMAAFTLAKGGARVVLCEKRKGLGRKLLIAGSSGLNISYDCPLSELPGFYRAPRTHFERVFHAFPPQAWLEFIEREMGIGTFKGTSRRYFVEGMKASQLLKAWTDRLKALGVEIRSGQEWIGAEFGKHSGPIRLDFRGEDHVESSDSFDGVCLALGGGSYEPTEVPLRWPEILKQKGLSFREFQPANAGYEVSWPEALLREAEGKPIKNVVLKSSRGERAGELIITRYGLEGTPVYFAGCAGQIRLDLKPSLSTESLLQKLSAGRENLSPIRRVKKYAGLSEGGLALFFHMAPPKARSDLRAAAECLKSFPLALERPRPLAEAISSSGGLSLGEVDETLMLKRFPGVFAAGEMLDWDAPTGGFLIQGSVSEGHYAAQSLLRYFGLKV